MWLHYKDKLNRAFKPKHFVHIWSIGGAAGYDAAVKCSAVVNDEYESLHKSKELIDIVSIK